MLTESIQACNIEFHQNKSLEATFSLKGVDASIANAFRRIMIAEIPTIAIEYVFLQNNTSIIQDEVLCSRLGLVPLKASVDGINWLRWFKKPTEEDPEGGSTPSDFNTLVLKLYAECTHNPAAAKDETDPKKLYNGAHVYAKELSFHPVGRQPEIFKGEGTVAPVNPDILIAKLRPGQVIDMELHCIKGIGADHAKFSPVATATYRLLPHIDIKRPIFGADAKKFQDCFPRGVIGLQPVTRDEASKSGSGYEGHEGEDKAVVVDPFKDTVSRECLRHEEFDGKVKLGRVRDHFIFNVESTGQFPSDLIFLESIKVLRCKCEKLKRQMVDMMTS